MLTKERKLEIIKEYSMMIAFIIMLLLQVWLGGRWTIPIWVLSMVANFWLLAFNYVEQNFETRLAFIMSGLMFVVMGPLALISIGAQEVIGRIVFRNEKKI
jgi:hypothetical protein